MLTDGSTVGFLANHGICLAPAVVDGRLGPGGMPHGSTPFGARCPGSSQDGCINWSGRPVFARERLGAISSRVCQGKLASVLR